MLVPFRRSRSSSRALTLLEMMIALGIFSIMLVTLGVAMWFFATSFKSNISQNRIQDQARYLMLRLSNLSAVSEGIAIIDKNGGTGNCLEVKYCYTNDAGEQSKQTIHFAFEEAENAKGESLGYNAIYEYPDPDSDPDRKIVRLLYVTREGTAAIWSETKSTPPLYELHARAGDRTDPPDRANPITDEDVKKALADDALTGPGYQAFVLRSTIASR